MSAPQPVSAVRIALRHWRLALLSLCLCVGGAAVATVFLPRVYEAETKFLVNQPRVSDAAPSPQGTETSINSEIELLKTRDLLERVVTDVHLAPVSSRALAVHQLSAALNLSVLPKTNIIQVTYRNADPKLAVAVLRRLIERDLDAHAAAGRRPAISDSLNEQVKRYNAQLQQARLALSNFHRRRQLFSLPEQQAGVIAAFQNVDSRLKDTVADLASWNARLAAAGRHLAAIPERVTTQVRSRPNQEALQQLQTTLTELRNRRIDLGIKFKPADRLIVDVDAQIASTQRDLAQVAANRTQETTTDLDAIRQAIQTDFIRGQVTAEGLSRTRDELASIRAGYLRQLNVMEVDSLSLANLEQRRQEAQDHYDLYAHRLAEARLAEALDQQNAPHLVMVEQPAAAPFPASPKLSVNLAAGVALSLPLFVVLAFFRAGRRRIRTVTPSIHSASDPLYPPRAYQAAAGD